MVGWAACAPFSSRPVYRGVVVSVASGLCWVRTEASDTDEATEPELAPEGDCRCVLPSHIAQDQKATVAVGDQARFTTHGDDFRLLEILPRQAFLARPDPLNPRRQRVVAANMDIVVIVVSVARPALHPALIDRYLIASRQGGAEALLAVNKTDLLAAKALEREMSRLDVYQGLDLPILPCSATTGSGIDALRQRLAGKTAVVVGHSGVGKSSLVNAMYPDAEAATGAISDALGKGRHTTTRSNLYDMAGNVRLIDTPGIREFGLWRMDAESLGHYFPDFSEHAASCRFRNCTHSHEPACAVRQAAQSGQLPEPRYATYLRILESLKEVR